MISCLESPDLITVYDGANESCPTIGTFCTTNQYVELISSGPELLMKFTSRSVDPGQGFRGRYMFQVQRFASITTHSVTSSASSSSSASPPRTRQRQHQVNQGQVGPDWSAIPESVHPPSRPSYQVPYHRNYRPTPIQEYNFTAPRGAPHPKTGHHSYQVSSHQTAAARQKSYSSHETSSSRDDSNAGTSPAATEEDDDDATSESADDDQDLDLSVYSSNKQPAVVMGGKHQSASISPAQHHLFGVLDRKTSQPPGLTQSPIKCKSLSLLY